jgi:hypothetical protein
MISTTRLLLLVSAPLSVLSLAIEPRFTLPAGTSFWAGVEVVDETDGVAGTNIILTCPDVIGDTINCTPSLVDAGTGPLSYWEFQEDAGCNEYHFSLDGVNEMECSVQLSGLNMDIPIGNDFYTLDLSFKGTYASTPAGMSLQFVPAQLNCGNKEGVFSACPSSIQFNAVPTLPS